MNNTAPQSTRIQILEIALTQAEGPSSDCGTTKYTTFAEANKRLAKTCQGMDPKLHGSFKHDFTLTYADGMTYTGSFETYHPHHRSHEVPDLGQHVRQHMEFLAGLWKPPHMDDESYARIMADQQREHPHREASALTFLKTYALNDLPRPAVAEDDGRKAQSIGDAAADVLASMQPSTGLPSTGQLDTSKPVAFLALDICIQQAVRTVTLFEQEVERLKAAGKPYAEAQTRAMTVRKALGILNTATNRNR